MILAKTVIVSATLAGTLLLAKIQGVLEPEEKTVKSKKSK